MNLSIKAIISFTHDAPDGYFYKVEDFKRGIFSIWLCTDRCFDYNLGKPTRTIWGFYDVKKDLFYSPVNSKTVGKVVKIEDTRPYTAMPIKQTALEACFS